MPVSDEERIVRLTERERQVLRFTAEGKTLKEIAGVLQMSHKTADCHRTRLSDKLNIHGLVPLTRFAIRVGLIEA